MEQKQARVAEVAAKLAAAQAVIVAEYRGLDVGRVTQLRDKARKSGLYLRVLKNTLARRAVKGTPFEKLTDQLVGPLMYGIAQDPVAGAKVLSEFAKENEAFVIKAGALPNRMMSAKDVKALALLPSREELLAARQQRQRLDVLGGHHSVWQCSGLDDEGLVFLRELGQHLRARDRILGDAVHQRPDQLVGQLLERRA